ncbi:MAG: aspartate dehydrogenase [Candidatus Thermoplasmatota archaeon]|nr:aspartate dehydrogenase [Candidatus Thermoplasmatota archaeon]
MRIGIVGCGFIGTTIGGALEQMEEIEVINLFDLDFEATVGLSSRLSKSVVFRSTELELLIDASDLVIEAASHTAVIDIVPKVVERGKDVMILSVGALVDDDLWNRIRDLARENCSRVYIPSGAVSGIDGIISASMADVDCVTLTVRKPPKGLSLPPELHHLSEDLRDPKEPIVLFEGNARDAVRLFPKNVNVAATVSLAGIGFDRTKVKIIADPNVQRNVQRIDMRGRFGEMQVQMENHPSTSNPRTSYMAPLSAISVIRKIVSGISIGN